MWLNLKFVCLYILLLISNGHTHTLQTENVVFQWNLLEFEFPTMLDRKQAIENGNLITVNAVPIDVQPHITRHPATATSTLSKVFITIPRFQTGIPYTLATVIERSTGSAILSPYPNYDLHKSHGTNCDAITSAFRVAITKCNQMWVIDSGVIGSVQNCPPQLLLFDLATDALVHRYRFDSSLYIPMASLFITPVLSVRDPPPGRCLRTMVYVADVTYHGLVVYDYAENAAWRVENKFMYPDPNFGTHTIAGENFTLMDGLFSMSLDKNNLYFHPLASRSEYVVPLSVLDRRENWKENNTTKFLNAFRTLGTRSSQCAAEAMDSSGNWFCVFFQPIRLIRWNINTPFKSTNFREIPINAKLLEFVSGMKVVKNGEKEELWMLSNRFQKIAAGSQKPSEINFRILKLIISEDQNVTDNDLHNKLIFT